MCSHINAQITIRHSVDRTFDAKGKQLSTQELPDGQLAYSCPDCGASGTGNANGGDVPRWVAERLAALPVVR